MSLPFGVSVAKNMGLALKCLNRYIKFSLVYLVELASVSFLSFFLFFFFFGGGGGVSVFQNYTIRFQCKITLCAK